MREERFGTSNVGIRGLLGKSNPLTVVVDPISGKLVSPSWQEVLKSADAAEIFAMLALSKVKQLSLEGSYRYTYLLQENEYLHLRRNHLVEEIKSSSSSPDATTISTSTPPFHFRKCKHLILEDCPNLKDVSHLVDCIPTLQRVEILCPPNNFGISLLMSRNKEIKGVDKLIGRIPSLRLEGINIDCEKVKMG
jgi:hypothetical protein